MKVAHFHESRPSLNVIQQRVLHENNSTPWTEDLCTDWTEYQEDQARHKAWKELPNRSLSQKTGASLHMMERLFSLSGGKEDHTKDQQLAGEFTSKSMALYRWTIRFQYCLLDDCPMNWSVPSLGNQEELPY